MADNFVTNSGTGGDTFAADEITGVKHQRVKVQIGADGSATDVSAANPMPVDLGTDNDVTVTGTVTVDGSAVTQPVSAASLPLPSGASTAANQLADGHNVTVDNAAGASAVNIQDGGNIITVDGTVTATGPLTDTELRAVPVPVSGTVTASGPLTDTELRATPVPVSGTVATGGLTDTELRATPVPVSGTVTADAGTNLNTSALSLETTQSDVKTAVELIDDAIVAAGEARVSQKHAAVSGIYWGSTGPPTLGAFNKYTPLRADASSQLMVSAAALPLPSGASTAASQLPDGHNVTVDNASGASAVNIQDGGNIITVDGTVTVTATQLDVDNLNSTDDIVTVEQATAASLNCTEASAAAILSDTTAILADTAAIDTNVVTIAGAVTGTEMQVDVVASLPAGTNAIGKLTANTGVDIGDVDVTSLPSSVDGPGAPSIDSYTTADVNLAAGTVDQVVVSSAPNKQIWVYGFVGTADAAGTISFQDEDNTALSGVMPVAANGGFAISPSGNFAMPWIKLATDKDLEIDTVTCTFDGIITYAIVSV